MDRYARATGPHLVAEFRDEGVSGTNELEAREGLPDQIAPTGGNGIRTVLVERADRLARYLMVGEVILAEFRKLGVCVIAADSGTDLTAEDDDPTRLLIRQILGAIARFDKALTVSKLKAARLRKRRAVGRKPFGTRPGQAEILALIRRLRRKPRKGERLAFAAVANRLNAEARPTELPPTGASSSSVPVLGPRAGGCSNECCE